MKRPYKFWNTKTKCFERWRYYGTALSAHNHMAIMMRWAEPRTTLELINTNTGKMLAQYTRTNHGITFTKG